MRDLALLLLTLIPAQAGLAQETAGTIPIHGTVSGEAAEGVPVAIFRIEESFAEAVRQLEGAPLEAAATAVTDSGGAFTIRAPEPGFWRVEVGGTDHAMKSYSFRSEPLLQAAQLPPVELKPAVATRIVVTAPDGSPIAGAWVTATPRDEPPRSTRDIGWRAELLAVRTSDDGTTVLRLAADTDYEIEAGSGEFGESREIVASAGDSVAVALPSPVVRSLQVVDAAGRPLAAVPVCVGGWSRPATLETDGEGRVALPGGESEAEAYLVMTDGRRVRVRLTGDEGTLGREHSFVVPEPLVVEGRVLDAEDRRPIAAAWVYRLRGPLYSAITDGSGAFRMPVTPASVAPIAAAARDRLPAFDEPREGVELALLLEPTASIAGHVVDPAGDPAVGATVLAAPHVDSLRALRTAFRGTIRHASTDGDGRFVLDRLPTGSAYRVSARLEGYAPAEAIVADVAETSADGPLVLRLGAGTTVVGVVVDGRSRPVGGAAIRLAEEVDPSTAQLTRFRRNFAPPAPETRSDSEGTFRFEAVPAGRFLLEIESSGYAPQAVPAFDVAEGSREVDVGLVVLEPGSTLEGVVLDGDGVPIAGATVGYEKTQAGFSYFVDNRSVTTGADGSFRIVDRREGEMLDLEVEQAGFVELNLPRVVVPTLGGLEIRLEHGAALEGRVVGAGSGPVAGASVLVTRDSGGTGSSSGFMPLGSGTTDEDGRFRIEDLEPTVARISVTARGWLKMERGEIELEVGDDPTQVELELERGATVEGRVLLADGTPAAGAEVRAVDSADRRRFRRQQPATVSGDGSYILEGVEPGSRLITVQLPDGPRVSEELEVEPGINTLDLVLPAGVEVSGRVLDEDGAAVEGALVSLREGGSFSGNFTARSGSDGAVVLASVQPGRYAVTAEHADLAATTLPEPIEVTDAPILGLEIRLTSGSLVTGRVLGLAAEELVGTEVVAWRQSGGLWKQGSVDSEGGFRLGPLEAGSWSVSVRTLGGRALEESLEILPGERNTTIDLDFGDKEGLTVTGLVLAGGTPLAGAFVLLNGIDSSQGGTSQTDHEGRFTVRDLPGGNYRLTVRGFERGVSHTEEIELLRDDFVTIEIDGSEVAGSVVDAATGEPLGGTDLQLELTGSDPDNPWMRAGKSATTDSQGRFRMADVPAGTYRLKLSRAGFATSAMELEVGRADTSELDLALDPVQGVRLQLRFPGGATVSRLRYAAVDATGRGVADGSVQVASDGLASLTTLPDGDWILVLAANGAATTELDVRAPAAEPIDVALEIPARWSVRVTELVGDASTVARVRLRTPQGVPFRDVQSGGGVRDSTRLYGGETHFDDLSPGRWLVTIETTDDRRWERSVTLQPGENESLVID